MKNLLLTITVLVAAVLFTGCSTTQPRPTVISNDDGVILIQAKAATGGIQYEGMSTVERIEAVYRNDLKISFAAAANKTLEMDKTHFVIVNPFTNHLKGFSLTTFKDIEQYCLADYKTDDELKGKCGYMRGTGLIRTQMKIIPMNDPSYLFSSIDAKEMLKELGE
jgi:hypothetical protein